MGVKWITVLALVWIQVRALGFWIPSMCSRNHFPLFLADGPLHAGRVLQALDVGPDQVQEVDYGRCELDPTPFL